MVKRKATTNYGAGQPLKRTKRVSLQKVNAKVNRLARAVEQKTKDFALKNDSVTGGQFKPSGDVTLLNQIIAGDGIDNRDGSRVHLKSLLMRYHISLGTETNFHDNYRLMIVHDKYSGGTPLTDASQILDFSAVIDGEEAMAPLNLANRDRFTILYDDSNGYGKCDHDIVLTGIKDYWTKQYVTLNIDSTFASGASIPTTGAVYLVTIGNQWASATTAPGYRFTFTSRIRFTDA